MIDEAGRQNGGASSDGSRATERLFVGELLTHAYRLTTSNEDAPAVSRSYAIEVGRGLYRAAEIIGHLIDDGSDNASALLVEISNSRSLVAVRRP